MKAVNLIPLEQRRNTSVAGRSGGGAYVVLGVLVALVALVAAYTVAGRTVSDRHQQLADAKAQADRVDRDAQRLQVYAQFADLKKKRADTVASIARSRFDWARSLEELARTLPAGISLTGVTGSVTPAVTTDGAVTDPLRAALADPALIVQGCATSQDLVAETLADLRRMEGVERVSLSASEKDASGSGTADCTGGSDKRPKFSMVVFFKPVQQAAASAAATTGTATTASTTTTSNGASN